MSNQQTQNLRESVEKWRLSVEYWQYEDPECIPVIKDIVTCLETECNAILTNFDLNRISEYTDRFLSCTRHIDVYIGQEDSDVRQALFTTIENATEYSYNQIYDSWLLQPPSDEDGIIKSLEHGMAEGMSIIEVLGNMPNPITPMDKETDVFECVDRKVTDYIKDIQEKTGLEELFMIVDKEKINFVEHPKGFNCYKLNSSCHGKINLLNHVNIDGVHDVFSDSQIMSCLLTYINKINIHPTEFV